MEEFLLRMSSGSTKVAVATVLFDAFLDGKVICFSVLEPLALKLGGIENFETSALQISRHLSAREDLTFLFLCWLPENGISLVLCWEAAFCLCSIRSCLRSISICLRSFVMKSSMDDLNLILFSVSETSCENSFHMICSISSIAELVFLVCFVLELVDVSPKVQVTFLVPTLPKLWVSIFENQMSRKAKLTNSKSAFLQCGYLVLDLL